MYNFDIIVHPKREKIRVNQGLGVIVQTKKGKKCFITRMAVCKVGKIPSALRV